MSITKRPISFDLTDIEESNIKPVVFSYDFPDIDPVYEKEKDNYDLVHKDYNEVPMNIKGVGNDISSKESNVSFDGTNYKLLDLIFTKGMDNTNGNSSNPDYEYAFVLKLQGVSSSKYMYIFIPIEDSTNQGPENMVEFLAYDPKKKSEDKKKNRPKLQLNALIPSASTYYYYEYKNNNLVLFFDTSTISLNMNGGGILTNSKWASNVQNNTVLTNNIYQGSSSVNQSIMSYADMGEIYIDCQPVDGGENEIIKPRNVYKMTPLFDTKNMAKSTMYFMTLALYFFLLLITFGMINYFQVLIAKWLGKKNAGKGEGKGDTNFYTRMKIFLCVIVVAFLFFASYNSLIVAIYKVKFQANVVLRIFGIVTAITVLFCILYNKREILNINLDDDQIIDFFDKKPYLILGIFVFIWGLLIGITILILNSFLSIENKDQDYYGRIVEFAFLNMPLLFSGFLYFIGKFIKKNNNSNLNLTGDSM